MSDSPNSKCRLSWLIPTKAHKGELCVEKEMRLDYLNTLNLATIIENDTNDLTNS